MGRPIRCGHSKMGNRSLTPARQTKKGRFSYPQYILIARNIPPGRQTQRGDSSQVVECASCGPQRNTAVEYTEVAQIEAHLSKIPEAGIDHHATAQDISDFRKLHTRRAAMHTGLTNVPLGIWPTSRQLDSGNYKSDYDRAEVTPSVVLPKQVRRSRSSKQPSDRRGCHKNPYKLLKFSKVRLFVTI